MNKKERKNYTTRQCEVSFYDVGLRGKQPPSQFWVAKVKKANDRTSINRIQLFYCHGLVGFYNLIGTNMIKHYFELISQILKKDDCFDIVWNRIPDFNSLV